MFVPSRISRRALILGVPLAAAGCSLPRGNFGWLANGEYGALNDNGITIPALNLGAIDSNVVRQRVAWPGPERPGSVVVDVPQRTLYLVQRGGTAMRYAVGVGRDEVSNFHGSAVIGRKEKWPRWKPTPEMMTLMPEYRAYAAGMTGGLGNPLGARALYLYRGGQDTLFRLHGTNEPDSIGQAVSSGCIRLLNHDIVDLYNRVPLGAPVVVVG
jgi:lipoprotein-anchoring transpeptidase ErfK/SrfK